MTSSDRTNNSQKKSIVVVEDNPAVRRVVVLSLRKAGFDVSEFSDAQEALSHFESVSKLPDLVITDVVMPKMDGRLFAKKIHESYGTKVLLMSGYSEKLAEVQLDFPRLQKPFRREDLLDAIRLILAS